MKPIRWNQCPEGGSHGPHADETETEILLCEGLLPMMVRHIPRTRPDWGGE